MKEMLRKAIEIAIEDLGHTVEGFSVAEPADLTNGDYSTNVALLLAKIAGEKPHDLAEKIVAQLEQSKQLEHVERITIAGPGFINFYLKNSYFTSLIQSISKEWGKSEQFKDKKILVEHSSPNLFKPFHIGHVMNNTIGESIKRLAEFSGAEVTAISYPSDVSLGIAKAVYVMLEDGLEKVNSLATISEKLNYLGECYVKGTKAFEEDKSLEPRIREITQILYDKKTNTPEYEAYQLGRDINLQYFKEITKRLGSEFNDFIFESEAGVEGAGLVRAHVGDVFAESDGAIIFKGEDVGLHTRVFITKEGNPIYEAKDIGLLSLKFSRFNPDLSIFITDHLQGEYFKVVMAAVGMINAVWKEHSIHRTHGRMSFKGMKMSSRLGGVPLAQDVLDSIIEEVTKRSRDLTGEANDIIAISALKFSILRSMAGKDINFDPDTSLSFEGDSGPYLLYSAVRAHSILKKANFTDKNGIKIPEDWQSTMLERQLIHFPEIVTRSIEEWAPHHVVVYLLELAQEFNSWYANTQIFDENDASSPYKLAITEAFYTTMKNGLYLLGIEVPEKM
jgi:arginyl-tRNA synthetase